MARRRRSVRKGRGKTALRCADRPRSRRSLGARRRKTESRRHLRALRRRPRRARAPRLLALESGDAEAAIRHLEAARARSPTPAVLYALATAYLRNRQLEQSASIAASLVQLEPSNPDLRLFYGRLLRDQKKYAEAAPQFQEAARLAPRSGEAWNELTAILMLLKQYEPALAALERARELNGPSPAYDYFRATMLDAMNQPKAALESYRRFLASSNGAHPDEEFKARQRVRILEKAVQR